MSYKITRFFAAPQFGDVEVKTGLTLEEAQAHCQDPETSSTTCTGPAGIRRTRKYGAWFDGYGEE